MDIKLVIHFWALHPLFSREKDSMQIFSPQITSKVFQIRVIPFKYSPVTKKWCMIFETRFRSWRAFFPKLRCSIGVRSFETHWSNIEESPLKVEIAVISGVTCSIINCCGVVKTRIVSFERCQIEKGVTKILQLSWKNADVSLCRVPHRYLLL